MGGTKAHLRQCAALASHRGARDEGLTPHRINPQTPTQPPLRIPEKKVDVEAFDDSRIYAIGVLESRIGGSTFGIRQAPWE